MTPAAHAGRPGAGASGRSVPTRPPSDPPLPPPPSAPLGPSCTRSPGTAVRPGGNRAAPGETARFPALLSLSLRLGPSPGLRAPSPPPPGPHRQPSAPAACATARRCASGPPVRPPSPSASAIGREAHGPEWRAGGGGGAAARVRLPQPWLRPGCSEAESAARSGIGASCSRCPLLCRPPAHWRKGRASYSSWEPCPTTRQFSPLLLGLTRPGLAALRADPKREPAGRETPDSFGKKFCSPGSVLARLGRTATPRS